MPRAFLVKKSSGFPIGHIKHHSAKNPMSDRHKETDLACAVPLNMAEYEHDQQMTMHTVERGPGFHGYYSPVLPSSKWREEHLKEVESRLFEEKLIPEMEPASRPSVFLIHSIKNKTYRNDAVKKENCEDGCTILLKRASDLQPPLTPNQSSKGFFTCVGFADKIAAGNEERIEKPSERNHCCISFKPTDGLQKHMPKHSSKNPVKYGKHADDNVVNEESIHREKPFQCKCCMMTFTQSGDLVRHHSLIHETKKPCQSEQNDTRGNDQISEKSGEEKPFKCSQCGMSFTRPSDLQRHSLIHSTNKPYKCEKCDRGFTWFGNFQKHILMHINNDSHNHGSFSAMFTLLAREHVKDLFIKEGDKYTCRLCSKDFTRLSGLKTHIRMHTGERPYVCEICSFAFTTSRALKMHTRLHTGEKPYKCHVCERAYSRRDEMHTHMYMHKGEKPYQCTQCSSSFIRYGHLQRHLLIHSKEKPYKCKLCPKSFTQYRNLQTHSYKHTGERPYGCKFCPKGFTQFGTLQAHERTHTGEKPFKCRVCEKAFITSSHLRWHIKTQHSKQSTE